MLKNFDLSKNFVTYKDDLVLSSEDKSILESVENIIMNEVGSIAGNNQIGSDVKKLLFKENTYFILFDLVKQIEIKIRTYETRISNLIVIAKTNTKMSELNLTVKLYKGNADETLTYNKQINFR